MKKNIFILGAGRFGIAAATTLAEKNVNVTLVDKDQTTLTDSNISDKGVTSLVLDSSNYDQLASSAITSADHVIVAISDIEASIMTCVNLKDLGIKNITAKSGNELHTKVLTSLGIKEVVFPEQIIGSQVAKQILSSHSDINYLFSGNELSIICIRLHNNEVIGRKLSDFENKDAYNFLAIKTNNPSEPLIMNTDGYVLQKLDRIFITIANDKLKNIKKYFGDILKESK